MTRPASALLLAVWLATSALLADSKVEQFFARHCVGCHGAEQQNGNVRLDMPVRNLVGDVELLESVVTVLSAGEMPPKSASGPNARSVGEVVLSLIHI